MNIGFDFRMGGVKHGGIGRYAYELLLAELEQDKVDTFYVFFNESNDSRDLETLDRFLNVELIQTSARHYSWSEQTLFLRDLNQVPLDIMHFPNFNHPILYKKPFVVTVHDMVHHRISGHKKSRWLYFKAYQMEMRHAVSASRAILVPSESSKLEVQTFFPGMEDKITVTYEGITLDEQTPHKVSEIKKQFLLHRPYFLFVGTLERKKNIVGLAMGFDALLTKYNLDVDLVFAGKPDMHYPEEKFKALSSTKHSSHIIFTGYLSDEDLAALYQGAHAYVNASLNEGFGLPGVEAMRFGIPLAVANTPVFNEIYDDAAVYFDPEKPEDIAEKLYLLATDKKFYETKQIAAAERSQFFSWDKTATETLAVLRSSAGKLQEIEVNRSLEAETY